MIRCSRTIFLLMVLGTITSGWGTAGAAAALPDQPLQRPAGRTKDCTNAGCHAQQQQFKFQLGPVAVGACDMCHAYVDERKHTFKLKEQKEALCTFCHIAGGAAVGKVVHKPFQEGDCLSCHNPHGGASRAILRKENLAALCADCHNDVTKKKPHLHGPVASGSCAACHASHRAAFPGLLAAQGRELCLSCHEQMGTQLAQMKSVHKPIEGDCQQCHETHASDHKMQLKKPPLELCESCHEPVQKLVTAATFKHSATVTGDACLNCHTSHGSDIGKLMKAEPSKACLSCHDKKIQVSKDHVVASMAAVKDPKQFKHGPLKDGDCSGCHVPHGGEVSRLLAKPYPDTFYQPFDIDKYSLCFSCHDKQLVLLEKTSGLTKFRNGEQNLHFLHVNKTDKGRNCRACHNTHTSTQPLHLRETVPYGKWEMPVSFKQSDTGGSCKPGCHEEMGYDRQKPVNNRPAGPSPVVGPTLAKDQSR